MEFLILYPLVLMIVSDFRYRRVMLWHLLLFGVLQMTLSFYRQGIETTSHNVLVNVLVLSIICCIVAIYARFRFGKKTIIGSGDIVFIFLISPYFSYPYFLYFLIVSSCTTLILWLIYRSSSSKTTEEVPLISGLGFCYSIILMYQGVTALC